MAKMRFRLEGGNHKEGGKVYTHGDTVESDKPLDVIFKRTRKFTRLSDSPSGKAGAGDRSPSLSDKFGSDVTSISHSKLLSSNVRVFQNRSWFNVIDVTVGKAINEKALRGAEVEDFIAEFLQKKSEAEAEAEEALKDAETPAEKPVAEPLADSPTEEVDDVSAAIAEAIKEEDQEA